MAFVRILVDGFSLLHNWPELAPGWPRYSSEARDALIQQLTHYRDRIATPITVVFDGTNAPKGASKPPSTRELEVLYSRRGQTADQVIERAAHRLLSFGEVLVVSDDRLERETVIALGGHAQSCRPFVRLVTSALEDLQRDLRRHNLRERNQFARRNHR